MEVDHISCGAVVFYTYKDTNLYILIQNVDGKHWDFPKGTVKKDETEEQTALREIQEEVGISATILSGFREEIVYEHKPGCVKKVILFVAKSPGMSVELQKEEILDSLWLQYRDAKELLTYDNVKEILEKAHKFLTDS